MEVLGKNRQSDIQRSLLIRENQTSQVEEFSAFLCVGRCKSLGSMKSFFWYTPQLSRASILFFSNLNPLRVQRLVAWWPQHPLFTDAAGDILHPHCIYWNNWYLCANKGSLEFPLSQPFTWQRGSWDPGKVRLHSYLLLLKDKNTCALCTALW